MGFFHQVGKYLHLSYIGGIPVSQNDAKQNTICFLVGSSLDACARLGSEETVYCGYSACGQRAGVGRHVFVTAAGSDTSQNEENLIFL